MASQDLHNKRSGKLIKPTCYIFILIVHITEKYKIYLLLTTRLVANENGGKKLNQGTCHLNEMASKCTCTPVWWFTNTKSNL